MTVLTPTKDLGATAMASDVVYVEPEQQVTESMLRDAMGMEGMNTSFVADVLSAAITHERCGVHLHRSVANRTNNPVLQSRYLQYGDDAQDHVEILESAIMAAGGNPNYISNMARATENLDSRMLEATYLGSGGIDLMTAEMAMLDAVFLGATIKQANWASVRQIAEALPAGELRDVLMGAAEDVTPQAADEVMWAATMRARMVEMQAQHPLAEQAAAKASEIVERVKSWFSDEEHRTSDQATAAAKQ